MKFYNQEVKSSDFKYSEPNSILLSLSKDHTSSIPPIVFAVSVDSILTNYYASSFPSYANYSFNGKIPESYL